MNAMRAAFVVAFLLIGLGMFVARSLATPLFLSDRATRTQVEAVMIGTATLQPTVRPTRLPRRVRAQQHRALLTASPTRTALPTRTPVPTATALPTLVPRHIRRTGHIRRSRPTPTSTPLPTASPAPTPTVSTGVITLARYWVNSLRAAPGQTIGVAYVIQNGTGRTTQVSLGASIKSTAVLTWGASLSDPTHDVVAILPPGISTHLRFFHLPGALHPGAYDVAWGLRNAVTGSRIALAEASTALKVAK